MIAKEGAEDVQAVDVAESPRRIDEFDVVRFIAACAVVFIHATARAVRAGDDTSVIAVANELADFAVPAFVMLAAALAWTRTPAKGWRAFFGARLAAIGIPYLVWSGVYLFIRWAETGWPKGAAAFAGETARALVSGRASFHLYFVPLVLLVYLIAPLVVPIARRAPELLFVMAVMLALATRGWDGDIQRFGVPPIVGVDLAGDVRLALQMLAFAAFGAYYTLRLPMSRQVLGYAWPVLVIAGFGIEAGRMLGLLRVTPWPYAGMLFELGALLGLGALLAKSRHVVDSSRRLSKLAFGVYLVHPLLIWVTLRLGAPWNVRAALESPMVALVAWPLLTVASFGVVWALRRFGIGKAVT